MPRFRYPPSSDPASSDLLMSPVSDAEYAAPTTTVPSTTPSRASRFFSRASSRIRRFQGVNHNNNTNNDNSGEEERPPTPMQLSHSAEERTMCSDGHGGYDYDCVGDIDDGDDMGAYSILFDPEWRRNEASSSSTHRDQDPDTSKDDKVGEKKSATTTTTMNKEEGKQTTHRTSTSSPTTSSEYSFCRTNSTASFSVRRVSGTASVTAAASSTLLRRTGSKSSGSSSWMEVVKKQKQKQKQKRLKGPFYFSSPALDGSDNIFMPPSPTASQMQGEKEDDNVKRDVVDDDDESSSDSWTIVSYEQTSADNGDNGNDNDDLLLRETEHRRAELADKARRSRRRLFSRLHPRNMSLRRTSAAAAAPPKE
ncbi:hypothetical protein F5Y17DRAFT_478493 [Xylariaceae sp. FL0594]|nr:hypothetical protein F5Y17DRAFT_478493 [Xylariaceae sp. FL0594]